MAAAPDRWAQQSATTGRTPIVGGNWKMNLDRDGATKLLTELRQQLANLSGIEVVIFPPAVWLMLAADLLADSALQVGVQNVYWEPSGAFTGEISVAMVHGLASWVLIGHSERRHRFKESDGDTNRKLRAVLEGGLRPILAVGELRDERATGRTNEVLRRQLAVAFEGLTALPPGFVIAYEPVWAIGTGLAATPELADDACAAIRAAVAARFDEATAAACRVQYGGSVNADNIGEFMRQPDIDGALVGNASLDAQAFAAICRTVAASRT